MPYPFRWVPGGEKRHVSTEVSSGAVFPPGTSVRTLCGARVESANDELAWLWPTCLTCAAEVRPLARAHNSADQITRRLTGLGLPS